MLGPLIGGFTVVGLGWRWTFWLLIIISGAIFLPSAVFMRETHPKTLLERKTRRLRASTGNRELRSKMASGRLTPGMVLATTLVRPCELLVRSPILLVVSIYVALIFGTMYLLFTTFTSVFEGQYGFSTSMSGLVYLGTGVALIFALVVFHAFSGRVQRSRMSSEGASGPKPEYHLVMMILFSPFVGLGLIMYGWTTDYQIHWIVPIIATVLIGFGAFFVIVSLSYSLDFLPHNRVARMEILVTDLLADASATILGGSFRITGCRLSAGCEQPAAVHLQPIPAVGWAGNVFDAGLWMGKLFARIPCPSIRAIPCCILQVRGAATGQNGQLVKREDNMMGFDHWCLTHITTFRNFSTRGGSTVAV